MARKASVIRSIRWTDKNRVYLQRAGFIDGRTGKKKSEALSLNELVNEAVTIFFEKHRSSALQDLVSTQQLALAWNDRCLANAQSRVEQAAAELRFLHREREEILRKGEEPSIIGILEPVNSPF